MHGAHARTICRPGHADRTGEALAASMSGYLITQLKATPTSKSGSAPELPTATAKPAWKP